MGSDDADEFDAEEALAASQESRRFTEEPDDVEGDQEDVEELSGLAFALVDALEAADGGDLSNRIQTRDDRLAVILEGLDRNQLDLACVVDGAAEQLPRDVDVDDPDKADAIRLLLEVGLRTVDEEIEDVDVVDAYRAANREHASSAF